MTIKTKNFNPETVIRNLRSLDGISVRNYGDSTYIIGNIIESITYAGASTVKLIAIENETQVNRAIIEDNIIVVDDRATATGEIRCINISPSASMTQLTIRNNSIYFTNQTALPIGINLTGIANIGRADIFNNLMPELGTTGILNYKNWLNLAALPSEFNFFNNGAGIEGCNISNEKQKYTKVFTYDFAVDDFGTVNIGELPTGAVITNATLSCKTTFTSSGSTNITIGVTTDDFDGILPSTLISDPAFTAGNITQGTPDNALANYTVATTDIRTIRFAIGGQVLTAGVIEITLEYIIA